MSDSFLELWAISFSTQEPFSTMYEPKPDLGLQPPENPAQRIWRYMDLARFISLLDRQALFFASAATMEDPCEGAQTDAAISDLRQVLEQVPQEHRPPSPEAVANIFKFIREDTSRDIGINCWHCNDVESAAMWGLYSTRGQGIAVQSTFERLRGSLNRCSEPVLVGMIEYSDSDSDTTLRPGLLSPYLHKGNSFEHERELRALVHPLSNIRERAGEPTTLTGTYVPVDLAQLVETVYVAPRAPNWFAEVVQAVLNQYGVTCALQHSRLYREPRC